MEAGTCASSRRTPTDGGWSCMWRAISAVGPIKNHRLVAFTGVRMVSCSNARTPASPRSGGKSSRRCSSNCSSEASILARNTVRTEGPQRRKFGRLAR